MAHFFLGAGSRSLWEEAGAIGAPPWPCGSCWDCPAGAMNGCTVVTTGGGSVDKVDVWGRRRLAYDIDHKSEGIYTVVDLVAEPDTVVGLVFSIV